jgi:hypothetical protein
MYFKLLSSAHNIDRNIVANNPDQAIKISAMLFPNVPLTIVKITHVEFHNITCVQ